MNDIRETNKTIQPPTFEEYPDIVTVKQLRQMLAIGHNQALDLIHSGEIKSFRIGRMIKIPKNSVINYIASQIN